MVEIVGKHRTDFADDARYVEFDYHRRGLDRRHTSVGSPGLQVTYEKRDATKRYIYIIVCSLDGSPVI